MPQILPPLAELDEHARVEPSFGQWRQGCGPLQHAAETQAGVFRLAH